MIILRGDNKNVDFRVPLKVNNYQFEKFIEYFKSKFYCIDIVESESFRFERMGEKFFTREWSSEEDALLFDISMTTEDMAKTLGRSWMSVDIRRGHMIPEILNFANKKGVDIYKIDIKKLIKEYREEHKDKLLKNKKERKERREKQKNEIIKLKRLEEEIPRLRRLYEQGILMNKEDLERREEKLDKLKDKLKDIEEE